MFLSSIPPKFNIPFANSAGAGFITPIPQASQIGIAAGRASLTDGFPPLTFIPVTAGGVPPFGADFNGLLNQITAWNQWQQAGGAVQYDAGFATAIGGYPKGALLSSTTQGILWVSTVNNNTTNPDSGGSNWVSVIAPLQSQISSLVTAQGISYSLTDATALERAVWSVGRRCGSSNYTFVTGNIALTADNLGMIPVNAPGGSLTVTLPPANCLGTMSAAARLVLFRYDNAPTNTVIVACAGSNTFSGGVATYTNLLNGEMLVLTSDGVNGWIATRPGASQVIAVTAPGAFAGPYANRVGVRELEVTSIGGGGGAGSGNGTQGGAGGGAGALVIQRIFVSELQSLTGYVGNGGSGATTGGTNGGNGEGTGLAGYSTAGGGTGGFGGNAAPSNSGGAGGLVTAAGGGSIIGVPGNSGSDGGLLAGAGTGNGGAGWLGGGGRAGDGGGGNGTWGSGGSGSYGASAGNAGHGGSGVIIIREIG